jgi:hypothetical protein
MFKIAFIIFYILFFILIPLNMTQAGLVPCGPGTAEPECRWNHFYVLFKKIIDFAIYNLVFPISAVMIVVGGIMIMTAGDSSGRVTTGKEIITAAVVGLLIALLSWLIIDTIMKILTNGRLGPWNQL